MEVFAKPNGDVLADADGKILLMVVFELPVLHGVMLLIY